MNGQLAEQPPSQPRRSETARLMTGQVVQIALARPADLGVVRAFYERLDDVATYHRFFGIRRHLPDGELLRVVGAGPDHVTLLARFDDLVIGIGEYIIGIDRSEAEVAFAVADDHHREGVATLLLERLSIIGHDRGLLRFTAVVLPDNADMRLVFGTVGLTTSSRMDDGVINVTLDLSSVVTLVAAAGVRSAGAASTVLQTISR